MIVKLVLCAFSFFRTTTAEAYLKVNDKVVSTFVTSAGASQAVTLICHHLLPIENATWVTFPLYIDKAPLSSTSDELLSNPDYTSLQWNTTFSRNFEEVSLTVDSRRAKTIARWQKSAKEMEVGYTLTAPVEADSGYYRCRATYATEDRKRILDDSSVVKVVIKDVSDAIAAITINDEAGVIFEPPGKFQPIEVRCRSFIRSGAGKMKSHRIYKAQNSTSVDTARNILAYVMTEYALIYDSTLPEPSIFKKLMTSASIQQTTNQDMTSGFDLRDTYYWDTGLYFCSATYEDSKNSTLTVNSEPVFVDVRGLPDMRLIYYPRNTALKSLILSQKYDTVTGHYICNAQGNTMVTAECTFSSNDYIPEIMFVYGVENVTNIKAKIDSDYVPDSAISASDVFFTVYYTASFRYTFKTADVCSSRITKCVAWVPGRPHRSSSYVVRINSDNCGGIRLESTGESLTPTPAIFILAITAFMLNCGY